MKSLWFFLVTVALLCPGPAGGQSSANFRLEGAKASASSGAGTSSANARAQGGVDASGVSGIASSANFGIASGLSPTSVGADEIIFRNGFEN